MISQKPDGTPNAQSVGSFTALWDGGSFRLENDFLMFNKQDRWRSNAAELAIGDFTVGTWLYNNDPKEQYGEQDFNMEGTDLYGKKNRGQWGAWNNGQTYASPFYFGVKTGNRIERIGYSSPWVQDRTQNVVHRNVPFGRQHFYNKYDYFESGIYLYTGHYNSFSLWH